MKEAKISFLNAFIDSNEDKNAQSIISLIEYKNYKLLLMGDAIEENENLLLKKYHLPLIDVLKLDTMAVKQVVQNIFRNHTT